MLEVHALRLAFRSDGLQIVLDCSKENGEPQYVVVPVAGEFRAGVAPQPAAAVEKRYLGRGNRGNRGLEVCDLIRRIRGQLQMKQTDLALALGLHARSIARYESEPGARCSFVVHRAVLDFAERNGVDLGPGPTVQVQPAYDMRLRPRVRPRVDD